MLMPRIHGGCGYTHEQKKLMMQGLRASGVHTLMAVEQCQYSCTRRDIVLYGWLEDLFHLCQGDGGTGRLMN